MMHVNRVFLRAAAVTAIAVVAVSALAFAIAHRAGGAGSTETNSAQPDRTQSDRTEPGDTQAASGVASAGDTGSSSGNASAGRTEASSQNAPTPAGNLASLKYAAASAGSDIGGSYSADMGPYTIKSIADFSLADKSRGRDIPLRITYPGAAGKFPVVIFSHGAGGSKDGYQPLAEYWASYGYVVIQPSHADSIEAAQARGERLTMASILWSIDSDQAGWEARAKDISFIIDSLGAIVKAAPELAGRLDAKKIAVAGHSYGAYTSQVIAGAALDLPDGRKRVTFSDGRVAAVLCLSPQGEGQMGLTENSWNAVALPTMYMTGSNDTGLKRQNADWRKEPFEHSPAGGKYLVFIEGAYHMSFSGTLAYPDSSPGYLGRWRLAMREKLAGPGPDAVDQAAELRIFNLVRIESLAFFDAYLKGSKSALAFIKGGAPEEYADIATVESK